MIEENSYQREFWNIFTTLVHWLCIKSFSFIRQSFDNVT